MGTLFGRQIVLSMHKKSGKEELAINQKIRVVGTLKKKNAFSIKFHEKIFWNDFFARSLYFSLCPRKLHLFTNYNVINVSQVKG